MSSAKWRSSYLDLNVLIYRIDNKDVQGEDNVLVSWLWQSFALHIWYLACNVEHIERY